MQHHTVHRKSQEDKGRILILEDDINREIWFRQKFIGRDCDFVSTVKEAIELLKTSHYDYIFLDMDLEENHYSWIEPRNDKTSGYAAALYLEQFPDRSANAKIIIHSCNQTESNRSLQALKSRKYVRHVPFPQLKEIMRIS